MAIEAKTQVPVFDHTLADCDRCELLPQCEAGRSVPAGPMPAKFNGIMLLGEGPGVQEVMRGAPFVGPSGHLLNSLLEAAQIKREECYVTNATLCQPPRISKEEGKKKNFFDRFPNAVYSCLPRLEAEIERVRPKVVVCFGAPALIAATGGTRKKAVQADNPCSACNSERKVGPALACSKGDCDWHHLFAGMSTEEAQETGRAALFQSMGTDCPRCGATLKRLKVRQIKCPTCGGKKKKIIEVEEFVAPYKVIGDVAGSLFRASTLPARWDELGVEWVITTYHPSFLLHTIEQKDEDRKKFGGQFAARAVVDHLEKALRLTQRAPDFSVRTLITDSAEDVDAWLEARGAGLYALDVETNAKVAWDVTDLRCIGIGRDDLDEVLVIDTSRMLQIERIDSDDPMVPVRFNTTVTDAELFASIARFLVSTKYKKIAQNGPYDWLVIRRLMGIEAQAIVGDTKHAHHHLFPDEPHDLQHIANEMTEVEHWKPPKEVKGAQAWESFTQLATYNAKDVRATALSFRKMAGELVNPTADEPEVWIAPTGTPIRHWCYGGMFDHPDYQRRNGWDVGMELLPIGLEMEYHGVPVDFAQIVEIEAELQPKYDAFVQQMREYVKRDDFNPRSPPQMAWALYDPSGPCKLVCPAKTKTGGLSASKDVLALLADDEFVQIVLMWKEIEAQLKFLHGKDLIIREDGRIHPVWNTVGTVSHRWTSSPNFQNLMKIVKKFFKAPDGWVFVAADESQLEMRILAALSGDRELIRRCVEANENDKLNPACDPHSFVASEFFREAYTELVPKRKDPIFKGQLDALRTITKTVFYALGYGSGAKTVLEGIYKKGYKGSIPLTINTVKGAMAKIYELFPGVQKYADEAIALAERMWEVRSKLLGRCRPFPLGKVESTVARNYPIQATAADLVDLLFIRYRRVLREVSPRSYPVLQVHDQIVSLVPEDEAEKVAKAKTEALSTEIVIVPGAPSMPFIGSAKIGKTLYDVA